MQGPRSVEGVTRWIIILWAVFTLLMLGIVVALYVFSPIIP